MQHTAFFVSEIRMARTAGEVVKLVKTFLANLTEDEREQIPWGLHADAIAGESDIAMWALQLLQDKSAPNAKPPGPVYGQAARIVSQAAERIAVLTARADKAPQDR